MNISARSALLLLVLLAAGCNQAAKQEGLRPSAGTNDPARANLNLAIAYMQSGDYERSLEKLDRARAADPDFSGIYNAYGLLYQLLERNQAAEKNFLQAMKLDPNDSGTRNNYGRFLCNTGRYREAQTVLLEAAQNPLYATPEIAITNAGICAYNNDDIEKAEEYLRRALELNKTNPTALLQMSRISYERNNYLSARAYLQRYLKNGRHTAASLWMGIKIERELGDMDAVASYSLSLRNNFPDSPEAGLLRQSEKGT